MTPPDPQTGLVIINIMGKPMIDLNISEENNLLSQPWRILGSDAWSEEVN